MDEDIDDDLASQIAKLFSREEETLFVAEPTEEHRNAYFQQVIDAIIAMPDIAGTIKFLLFSKVKPSLNSFRRKTVDKFISKIKTLFDR